MTQLRLLLLAISIILGWPVLAQTTLVSGTVSDADNQTWNNGTYKFSTAALGVSPITGSLSSTGTYTNVSIPHSSATALVGDNWALTVCAQWLTTCFSIPPTVISGVSQTLNVSPGAIRFNLQSTSQPVVAYSTIEVTNAIIGSQFYLAGTGQQVCSTVSGNSCTTWTGSGFSSLVPGNNTNSGLYSFSQTGVYTNTQFNGPYFSLSLNSCSPSSIYSGIHSGNNSTDALDGCVATPSGATVVQANGVGGYATTNQNSSGGTVADTVGVFGACKSLTSGGGCWGMNGGATDGWPGAGVASRLEGGEFDCWVANASSTCFAVQAASNMSAQPTQNTNTYGNAPAVLVTSAGTGLFTSGFACAPIATENGSTHGDCVDIGAIATSGDATSQSINFHAIKAGVVQSAYLTLAPSTVGPNLLIVPIVGGVSGNGSNVAIVPPAHGTSSGLLSNGFLSAGTCVFSASTSCVFTFTTAYTAAPICTATEVGTTPASLINVEVTTSTTALTITAASSNSATWNFICMPAAN